MLGLPFPRVHVVACSIALAACADPSPAHDEDPLTSAAHLTSAAIHLPLPRVETRATALPMVTRLLSDQPAPLPLATTSFPTNGGKLVVTVSGSARTEGANAGPVAVDVLVDDTPIGTSAGVATGSPRRKARAAATFVVDGVAAGTHTITLRSGEGTVTTPDDTFTVSVAEVR